MDSQNLQNFRNFPFVQKGIIFTMMCSESHAFTFDALKAETQIGRDSLRSALKSLEATNVIKSWQPDAHQPKQYALKADGIQQDQKQSISTNKQHTQHIDKIDPGTLAEIGKLATEAGFDAPFLVSLWEQRHQKIGDSPDMDYFRQHIEYAKARGRDPKVYLWSNWLNPGFVESAAFWNPRGLYESQPVAQEAGTSPHSENLNAGKEEVLPQCLPASTEDRIEQEAHRILQQSRKRDAINLAGIGQDMPSPVPEWRQRKTLQQQAEKMQP